MANALVGVQLPDVKALRQYYRTQLAALLDSVAGPKDLVLDAELMRPLDRVAGASLLKEHGVDKIYKLEPGKTLPGCEKRIYIVRPLVLLTRYITDQINAERSINAQRSYKILFVPRKLHVCELILEREAVMGYVTVDEFPLDLIPLDRDILSLETPQFFRSFYLEGDQTCCHLAARSLINIQQTFGPFANVYGIGRCAQMVYELSKMMMDSLPAQQTSQLNCEIGHLFLVDRDCDYVTPLCSQVTYEGLLDDTFGIRSGFVEFGPEVIGRDQKAKQLLSSDDAIYEEIRNRHFSNVSSYLSMKAKELQTGYDKRHTLATVSAMKDFVAKELGDLKAQHKSLALHVGACEFINNSKTKGEFEDQLHTEHSLLEGVDAKECINYIEELINKQFNMMQTLRLLCLLSVTSGGLPSQTYRSLKTQFVQSYGFETLLTLQNLRRLGLFTESDQLQAVRQTPAKMAANVAVPCPFRSLARKLNLIPKSAEDINLKVPNDMSYVFSGAYAPLLCRLVEQVLEHEGFFGLDDLMKSVSLPTFADCKARSTKGGKVVPSSRVVMVYFLGGCTYSEIAALRFLGRQRGYKVIIATSFIVNGISMLLNVSDSATQI